MTNGAYKCSVYGIGEPTVSTGKTGRRRTSKSYAHEETWIVGHGIGKKQHPAEQTHILAAMIQLFQVGLDVLYAVDYTGAIRNFTNPNFGHLRNGSTAKIET